MRKVDLKTGKLEIVFSIFLLLFALEPLFGSVPAADYAVWGLIVLCLVLMVVLMIKDLVKDARPVYNHIQNVSFVFLLFAPPFSDLSEVNYHNRTFFLK